MAQREILQLVERATDSLPEDFRTVFITRVIEGMSVEETAELLGHSARKPSRHYFIVLGSLSANNWTSRSVPC